MSGPIVRTGTNPKFWSNWDRVFGGGTGKAATSTTEKSVTAEKKSAKAAKSVKKSVAAAPALVAKAAKKATKKAAKKATKKR